MRFYKISIPIAIQKSYQFFITPVKLINDLIIVI